MNQIVRKQKSVAFNKDSEAALIQAINEHSKKESFNSLVHRLLRQHYQLASKSKNGKS